MGMDTLAYKTVGFDEKEGFFLADDYDTLNGRTKNWFKYPNSELDSIAEKFLEVSKGDIDFTDYIMCDVTMNFDEEDEHYIASSKAFYEEVKAFDFDNIIQTLENALAYYDEYTLDFQPTMYGGESDREMVEYLLELAKERYYIFWTN